MTEMHDELDRLTRLNAVAADADATNAAFMAERSQAAADLAGRATGYCASVELLGDEGDATWPPLTDPVEIARQRLQNLPADAPPEQRQRFERTLAMLEGQAPSSPTDET